jgi:hypothetical protein
MHLKVFVKLTKTLKTLSPGQKNPKKPKKPKKTQKNPKKPTGLGFFKKTRVFSNPDEAPASKESVKSQRMPIYFYFSHFCALGSPDPHPQFLY